MNFINLTDYWLAFTSNINIFDLQTCPNFFSITRRCGLPNMYRFCKIFIMFWVSPSAFISSVKFSLSLPKCFHRSKFCELLLIFHSSMAVPLKYVSVCKILLIWNSIFYKNNVSRIHKLLKIKIGFFRYRNLGRFMYVYNPLRRLRLYYIIFQ